MSPTAPLSQALGDFVEALTDKKRKLTQEHVDSVLPTGQVIIRGNILPVTGRVPIIAGETVTVAWRNGKMDLVMLNQGRRGGAAAPDIQLVTGIVEELFVTEGDQGLDVWFRNADQFKALRFVDAQGNAANSPTALDFVGGVPLWGLGDADFFVFSGTLLSGDRAVAVYRLNRPAKNEPFPSGFSVSAQLVKLYNLSTDPAIFGTATLTGTIVDLSQSGTVSAPLKYDTSLDLLPGVGPGFSPFGILLRTATRPTVAPNGDLVIALKVTGQHSGQAGQTDQVFMMGSLLINVTRDGLILENRLADSQIETVYVNQTSLPPTCVPLGTVRVDLSVGGPAAGAGEITVLSLTGINRAKPADPNEPGTFNNLVLLGPSTVYSSTTLIQDPPGLTIGEMLCTPLRSPLTLSIVGEFEDGNTNFETFPQGFGQTTDQVVRYQGSRTMVLFAAYGRNGLAAGPPMIRDLRRKASSPLTGNADLIFRIGLPVPNSDRPLLQLLQASLIYSPFDSRAPFNRQFFVNGPAGINLAALRKVSALAEQAKLAPARSAAQVAMAEVGGQARQAIDSRENLGARFQSGPL